MTEKLESVEGAPEPQAPPVPDVSEASVQPAASVPEVDADALVERLSAKIEELVDRKFQSAKDRRFADVEKIASYLKSAGGDVQKAAREMALDQFIEAQGRLHDASLGTVPSADNERVERMQARTAEILADAGIDSDDPGVAELAKRKVGSEAEWYAQLARFTARRAKAGAGVKASAVVQETGKPPSVPEDEEAIAAELAALQAEGFAKGTLAKPENIQKRKELKDKLAALRE